MKITCNVKDRDVADALQSAFEGGSNYWMEHRPMMWGRIASGNGDASDGDALLQAAVLRDIVYG